VKVSIIYLNWNTTKLTLNSIRSLRNLNGLFDYEVIVADNGSDNFDPADITKEFPEAKVVENGENLGFARGNNAGAKVARGEYLWILNTDTLVPADHHLERLVEWLDRHPAYAAAAPRLTNDLNEVQPGQVAYFPTPVNILLNIPARLLAGWIPGLKHWAASVNYDYRRLETGDVEVVVAAALFVRRSAFEEVGGFSPEFFFFFEDSDLCRKLWQSRHKIRFVAESHMVHLWGKSITGNRSFSRRKELYFKSQDVYLRKWHSPIGGWIVKCLRLPLTAKYWVFNR
jgi:GT2 family glycosyltransferase